MVSHGSIVADRAPGQDSLGEEPCNESSGEAEGEGTTKKPPRLWHRPRSTDYSRSRARNRGRDGQVEKGETGIERLARRGRSRALDRILGDQRSGSRSIYTYVWAASSESTTPPFLAKGEAAMRLTKKERIEKRKTALPSSSRDPRQSAKVHRAWLQVWKLGPPHGAPRSRRHGHKGIERSATDLVL